MYLADQHREMRSPRHHFKKLYGEWRIAGRRDELQREISEALERSLTLTLFGDGGNDSVYLAREGTRNVAVVRLINPYKCELLRWKSIRRVWAREPESAGSVPGSDSLICLNREWRLYEQLADSGITPRPLWRTSDATVVAYLEGVRMHRLLPGLEASDWWGWIGEACRALAKLQEYGVAHLDAKASNVILNRESQRAHFVDLGSFPLQDQCLPVQKAFDYLKLISSLLQIAPRSLQEDGAGWFEAIDPHVPPDVREADTSQLLKRKTLRHLERSVAVRQALAPVFSGIQP